VKDLPSLDSTSEPGMNFRSPRRRGCRGAGSKLKNRAKYTADKANRSIRNDNLRTTESLSPESHQGTSVNKSTFNDGKMFERNKQRGKTHVRSEYVQSTLPQIGEMKVYPRPCARSHIYPLKRSLQ
jgi:hypothetical protein